MNVLLPHTDEIGDMFDKVYRFYINTCKTLKHHGCRSVRELQSVKYVSSKSLKK